MSSRSPASGRGARGKGGTATEARGALAWMAKNAVSANMLMLVLLLGGLVMLLTGRIEQEVFPEIELDVVLVQVPYPGASPEEVEQGAVLAIEEAVRGLDGIRKVRATATEGSALVSVELLLGTDPDRALSDVKAAIDGVVSFPEDVERPVVRLASTRGNVVSIVFHGDAEEGVLRAVAERARDDLLASDNITQVELSGVRPREIGVEVREEALRKYDLTLQDIAIAVRGASVDVPAGEIKTDRGDVLLRTQERRNFGRDYERVVLLSRTDGSEVALGDIATIDDGFQDVGREAFFNGKRAAMVDIFRVGDETPIEVSAAAAEWVRANQERLPPGIAATIWGDTSEIYHDRVNLLARNLAFGLVLVLLTLALFLEMRLAFWVTLGIPVSFAGALLFMPLADASLNMISLFAFIVTLGMVVDDAIVVGEAVYKHRQGGAPFMTAAIRGVREVAAPVVFAVLTTCIAFAPMLFVPGVMGKIFRVIPTIVILVLGMSLVESLLILPAHLAHAAPAGHRGFRGLIHRQQQRFSRGVEGFVAKIYEPVVRQCVRWRYLTLSSAVALLVISLGLVLGGRMSFTAMSKIDHDLVTATLEMPAGTPASITRRIQSEMARTARAVLEEEGNGQSISRGVYSELGSTGRAVESSGAGAIGGSHVATVMTYLVPSDQRTISAGDFADRWRERLGDVAGAQRLEFNHSLGGSSGASIDVELSHPDGSVLERAAASLATRLGSYAGVIEINDGVARGKEQLNARLTQRGRAMGFTEADLARQLRGSFYGVEALRQQRGRDEVGVFVRLPRESRESLSTIESMVLTTPGGGEVPLSEAATLERGHAYTGIHRSDARRTIDVTAEVVPGVANANEVMAALERDDLPELLAQFPALSYATGGAQEGQAEVLDGLKVGVMLALLAMYALLAVAFRSYVQPIIIMIVIPFGLVGALFGHLLMGYDLSLMSAMGIVALSGVVVNDSLILLMAINGLRVEGRPLARAVVEGPARRFRPIVLTSFTTFLGLVPMIFETSLQARFLIPLAISLGFGVLFATVITLVIIPVIYAIVEDLRGDQGTDRVTSRQLVSIAGD